MSPERGAPWHIKVADQIIDACAEQHGDDRKDQHDFDQRVTFRKPDRAVPDF